MDMLLPDIPEFLRTIIIALVATIAMLVAFLAAISPNRPRANPVR